MRTPLAYPSGASSAGRQVWLPTAANAQLTAAFNLQLNRPRRQPFDKLVHGEQKEDKERQSG